MKKPYTLLDHTADLRIRIRGADRAELFANAGLALADLICDPSSLKSADTATIAVTGDDPADLLVNFLRELLYQWTGRDKLIKMVETIHVSETSVSARVTVDQFTAAHHTILNEIKAVTYHQIEVAPTPAGWQATVVFDI